MKTRYIVRASAVWDNSFNVIDTARFNQWGEAWVEEIALSYEQAVARAKVLNQSTTH